ncbi:GNAT family N-acetyltransferase [Rhodobacterales bacterium LSUCC0031]|nr:GNAT family N-acetyltransferase [Rhodobacterales bacterium LSUCC0031]
MPISQADLRITSATDEIANTLPAFFGDVFTAAEGADEGAAIAALVGAMIALPTDAGLRAFTAQHDRTLVGAVLFSPLHFADGAQDTMLLSPMAVATAHQGQGIGQALITHALARLAGAGVQHAVTYGDPAFYGRVGFSAVSTDDLAAPYPLSHPQGWIAQSLTGAPLPRRIGPVRCVAPLADPAFW